MSGLAKVVLYQQLCFTNDTLRTADTTGQAGSGVRPKRAASGPAKSKQAVRTANQQADQASIDIATYEQSLYRPNRVPQAGYFLDIFQVRSKSGSVSLRSRGDVMGKTESQIIITDSLGSESAYYLTMDAYESKNRAWARPEDDWCCYLEVKCFSGAADREKLLKDIGAGRAIAEEAYNAYAGKILKCLETVVGDFRTDNKK